MQDLGLKILGFRFSGFAFFLGFRAQANPSPHSRSNVCRDSENADEFCDIIWFRLRTLFAETEGSSETGAEHWLLFENCLKRKHVCLLRLGYQAFALRMFSKHY